MSSFTHLHLHSEYSLLDGGNRMDRLLTQVKKLGMDSVAVTDHGNLYGAAEFQKKADKLGIKSILGIEAYVAPRCRSERKKQSGDPYHGHHLVLLAETSAGWSNLVKLSSKAFTEGFYGVARMDKELLETWRGGLIAINGHLGSSLASLAKKYHASRSESDWDALVVEAKWHAEIFGVNDQGDPCFYVELQRHSVQDQLDINPHLIRLAKELDLPLVCDNDAHFLRAEDWDAHDTLCCISMNKEKQDPGRFRYPRELYVKSADEMHETFHDVPEALVNTSRIAERCSGRIQFGENHAPVVKIKTDFPFLPQDSKAARKLALSAPSKHPVGSTNWFKDICARIELEPAKAEDGAVDEEELKNQCDAALRVLSEAGAIWRYGPEPLNEEQRERLDRELGILADKLISAYFLIVWDFVDWARTNGIPSNARGSGVGTMVGYVLGLSNACPVEYGLLFERFTDPDRAEYPDIDIDMCQFGREDVIRHVTEKYGYVAQINTFGRLKARAAIKDVSRVHGLPPHEGQRIANFVPDQLDISLEGALEADRDFQAEYNRNPEVQAVVDMAKNLEYFARNVGVHAAGLVIATRPLDDIVPLRWDVKHQKQVTQWDGPTCEEVGLLKMDLLGLRTLSTIERAKKLIRESLSDEEIRRTANIPETITDPLDLERLGYTDQKVFDLYVRGDTVGVFQFESEGMQRLLRDMRPDRLEDLIAANALFRPGPMDLIPDYCKRKHGEAKVPSIHPIVDSFTKETYGIMVYQEQVMQIVHHLGGIPLRSAYTLIKAISKKKKDVIDSNRVKFVEGAGAKGLAADKAEELFELINKFAGYGFNKSHSTGYSIVSYQTAWLKTYFPAQYMAAVLTLEGAAKKIEDLGVYLQDCREVQRPQTRTKEASHGVSVRSPDVNLSVDGFTVAFDHDEEKNADCGHIRFGLDTIKNVSSAAVQQAVNDRNKNGPFKDVLDFCVRVSDINKTGLECLIKSGAFDSLHGFKNRSSLAISIEEMLRSAKQDRDDHQAGQGNLFGGGDEQPEAPSFQIPQAPEWTRMQSLENEREVLGIWVSGHPLVESKNVFDLLSRGRQLSDLAEMQNDANISVCVVLSQVRPLTIRQGQNAGSKMAMMTLQDLGDKCEGVIFSDGYAKCASALEKAGSLLFVMGRVDRKRSETPQLVVSDALTIDQALSRSMHRIDIRIPQSITSVDEIQSHLNLLQQHAQVDGISLHAFLMIDGVEVEVRSGLRFQPSLELYQQLTNCFGADSVVVYLESLEPSEPVRFGARRQ